MDHKILDILRVPRSPVRPKMKDARPGRRQSESSGSLFDENPFGQNYTVGHEYSQRLASDFSGFKKETADLIIADTPKSASVPTMFREFQDAHPAARASQRPSLLTDQPLPASFSPQSTSSEQTSSSSATQSTVSSAMPSSPRSRDRLDMFDFSEYASTIQEFYEQKEEGERKYWLKKESSGAEYLPPTICDPADFYDERPFICLATPCESKAFSFKRKADLHRHYETVHGLGRETYPCPKTDCDRRGSRSFTRPDHLKEHLRQFHKMNLPKRKSLC